MHTCDACAGEVAVLAKALGLHRLPDTTGAVDLAPRFLECATGLPVPRRSVSMRDWLLAGAAIVASMVLVPLLAAFRQLHADNGSGLAVSVSLVFGVLITLYASLFVMGHQDELSRWLKAGQARHAG
jgi:hypothetical protein